MNIIVIGNGFDIAHELPTTYPQFLKFCKCVFPIYENAEGRGVHLYQQEYLFEWNFNKEIKEALKDAYGCRRKIIIERNQSQTETDYPKLDEMYSAIKDNIWIEYFFQCNMYQKSNWIDFESEISKVIQSLDKDRKNFEFEYNTQLISNNFLNEKYYETDPAITYKQLRDKLLRDLNRLIRAFEIYLAEYVEKIECNLVSPDIQRILPKEIAKVNGIPVYDTYILSFNYTNTFQRLYIDKEHSKYFEKYVDYIHGKADSNNTVETNNMVLGIDEYLGKEERNKQVEFIAFKKFYQRIHKGTGCKYKEWVDGIKEGWENETEEDKKGIRKCISRGDLKNSKIHRLYIFGHSLDITDRDILRDLILNDNVHTTIYYHNKDTMGQQIANLVKVIGQDELIKRTGGSAKTIKFEPQQLMIDKK